MLRLQLLVLSTGQTRAITLTLQTWIKMFYYFVRIPSIQPGSQECSQIQYTQLYNSYRIIYLHSLGFLGVLVGFCFFSFTNPIKQRNIILKHHSSFQDYSDWQQGVQILQPVTCSSVQIYYPATSHTATS